MDTLPAGVRPANPDEEARAALAAWKLDTGVRPFGDAGSHVPRERSRCLLTQASSLTTILAAGCNDARALTSAGQSSEFRELNDTILGGALDGIGSLVDFANFLLED
jgi:hypothetical protein